MASLTQLIAQAEILAGSEGTCAAAGHDWQTDGGRACPRDCCVDCSQAVYVCARCGAQDYGGPGGPAHKDCFVDCRHETFVPDEEPIE